jgi:poly(3-hydroxybutyrate) depolymerase
MSSRLAISVVIAIIASSQAARADDKPPCEGCVFVPAESDGRPLVILMHGDEQTAAAIADAFRATAHERDFALFAPQCPVKLKCDQQSFWRWNGDPSWLGKLVDDLVKDNDLDRDRVWLVTWSGGGSYIGYRMPELGPRYAAIAFLGGAAYFGSCAKAKLPVFFLAGDKSPYFTWVKQARDRFVSCGHDLTWKELKGKDHDDEWHIIDRPPMQNIVFDWLEAHPRQKR